MARYHSSVDLFAGRTSTDTTSNVYWVGNAEVISLFLRGSPSTTTVQVNLADGRAEALPATGWSHVTTIVNPGPTVVDITPVNGWLRCIRSATTEVRLVLRNVTR